MPLDAIQEPRRGELKRLLLPLPPVCCLACPCAAMHVRVCLHAAMHAFMLPCMSVPAIHGAAMHACVCLYTAMHACELSRMPVCCHACLFAAMHACELSRMPVCCHACLYAAMHACVYLYAAMLPCMPVCCHACLLEACVPAVSSSALCSTATPRSPLSSPCCCPLGLHRCRLYMWPAPSLCCHSLRVTCPLASLQPTTCNM